MSEGQRGKGGAKSRLKRWFTGMQLITGPGERLESLASLKQGKRSKILKKAIVETRSVHILIVLCDFEVDGLNLGGEVRQKSSDENM